MPLARAAQGIARSVLARGRALQAVDPWLLDISGGRGRVVGVGEVRSRVTLARTPPHTQTPGPSAWKPAAASYQYALTELGMEPHQVWVGVWFWCGVCAGLAPPPTHPPSNSHR